MSLDELARAATNGLRSASEEGLDVAHMRGQLDRTIKARTRSRVAALTAAAAVVLVLVGWVTLRPHDRATQFPIGPTTVPSPATSSPGPQHVSGNGALLLTLGNTFAAVDAQGVRVSGLRLSDIARAPLSSSWSPDGREFAYTTEIDVRLQDVRTGTSRRVSTCAYCSVAWSPDGRQLAVATRAGLQLWSLAGGDRTTVVANSTESVIEPAWSPNGDRIAYVTVSADRMYALHVVAIDGSGAKTLLGPSAFDREWVASPSWSADGSRLAFIHALAAPSAHADFALSVAVVRAGGGRLSTLAKAGTCYCVGLAPALAWSPDGGQLAVLGGAGLEFIRADGTVRRRAAFGQNLGPNGPISWQPIP